MRLHAGTSGFGYKEWKGSFYPEKLPAKEMLGYYAERLPAVEINNTFYRMPSAETLAGWASQVPETFRFSVKASRRITHMKRLKNCAEETEYLLTTCAALGDRLGVVLFQTPPNLKKDVDRLRLFLETLPAGTRATFEFRHDTWADDDVFALLRAGNFAYCVADAGEDEPAAGGPRIVSTADWGYLRLRRPSYTDGDLRRWLDEIGSQEWGEAFVFFKHEDEAAGPRMSADFLRMAPGASADDQPS